MSVPPPGWHSDPHTTTESQPVGGLAGPASPTSQFAAYDAPGAAPGLNQFVAPSAPTFAPASPRGLTQRNPTTCMAIFVVALYLVLAATTGIVLIGIFPAVLAIRAFQRREPLAALAIAAAAVAIIFSFTVLTRH